MSHLSEDYGWDDDEARTDPSLDGFGQARRT